ncbi:Reticulocyte-binding protein 2 a [Merluccius polli]|uniref:Reticulocyte-binding protein 2 a n=1 Tax=Merluccius polli TaxID=89951 RepID=A0AA47NU14_MERPO|nr:Reticulocyte-binding protein 2 a [Merluccius polli]
MLSSLGARRDRSPLEDQPPPPKSFVMSDDEPVEKRARVLSDAPSSTQQMAPEPQTEPRVLHQQQQVPTIVVQEYRDEVKMSSPPLPYSYAQAVTQTRPESALSQNSTQDSVQDLEERQIEAQEQAWAQQKQEQEQQFRWQEQQQLVLMQEQQLKQEQQEKQQQQQQQQHQPQQQQQRQPQRQPQRQQTFQQHQQQQMQQQHAPQQKPPVHPEMPIQKHMGARAKELPEAQPQPPRQPAEQKQPLSQKELQGRKALGRKNRPWLQKKPSDEQDAALVSDQALTAQVLQSTDVPIKSPPSAPTEAPPSAKAPAQVHVPTPAWVSPSTQASSSPQPATLAQVQTLLEKDPGVLAPVPVDSLVKGTHKAQPELQAKTKKQTKPEKQTQQQQQRQPQQKQPAQQSQPHKQPQQAKKDAQQQPAATAKRQTAVQGQRPQSKTQQPRREQPTTQPQADIPSKSQPEAQVKVKTSSPAPSQVQPQQLQLQEVSHQCKSNYSHFRAPYRLPRLPRWRSRPRVNFSLIRGLKADLNPQCRSRDSCKRQAKATLWSRVRHGLKSGRLPPFRVNFKARFSLQCHLTFRCVVNISHGLQPSCRPRHHPTANMFSSLHLTLNLPCNLQFLSLPRLRHSPTSKC